MNKKLLNPFLLLLIPAVFTSCSSSFETASAGSADASSDEPASSFSAVEDMFENSTTDMTVSSLEEQIKIMDELLGSGEVEPKSLTPDQHREVLEYREYAEKLLDAMESTAPAPASQE